MTEPLPDGPTWKPEPAAEPLDLPGWLEQAPAALEVEQADDWDWAYRPTTSLLTDPDSPVLTWQRLVEEGPPGEGASRAERRTWAENRDAATEAAREAVQAARDETAAYLENRDTRRRVELFRGGGLLEGLGKPAPTDRQRLSAIGQRAASKPKTVTQQGESGAAPGFGEW